MYDPNAGRFNLEKAEATLGIDEESQQLLRVIVAVDMICAHLGITEEQLRLAYESKVKAHVAEAARNLESLLPSEPGE